MSDLKTNDPILIRKVANGYELTASYEQQSYINRQDIHVFESFEGLVAFLEDHFTWRNTAVKEDYDDEKMNHGSD